jgi:hypothetical protein
MGRPANSCLPPAALDANYRQRQDSRSGSGQEWQVERENDVHAVTPPADVAGSGQ